MAASLAAVAPSASAIPAGDEPGLTMRAFQLGQSISELCTLKAGQTPNVDLLKQTIDWTPADFGGLAENFVVEALANLSVATAGTYTFRLASDDGSGWSSTTRWSSTTTACTATPPRTATSG